MTHSTDLQWQLVRRNSKFLQLRGGIRLSSDPFNNNGNWTLRQSGFVQTKAAVVKVKGEKQLYATVKSGDNLNKPKQMFKKTVFDANVKASTVSKAVAAVRPDLADVTFRRARKLAKALSRTKKLRTATKARSAKLTFKRKATRKSQKK